MNQRKSCINSCGTEKLTDMEQHLVDEQKEKWQQELQDIEQQRNDLLAEDQWMQKRSQTLHSLQFKKKQCPKDPGKRDGEMERIREKLQKERLVSKNLHKNPRGFTKHKQIWMKESELCKKEKKGEAVVHLSPTDAASILPWWRSSSWEQHKHGSSSKPFKGSSAKDLRCSISQRQSHP